VVFTSLDFEMAMPNEKTGQAKVVVRPEHIIFNKNGEGIKGILINKLYLGDSTDCRVQAGSEIIRVIEKGAAFQNYEAGEELWLKFDKINIFPQ
jgi:ABC-type Fe3+/spermidine/putrescine transport system ATPase subunit